MRMIAAVAACLMCMAWQAAVAQEFRVETDLFRGDEKTPSKQYLTIFANGIAYDFPLNDPHRATIYDVSHNRIVLLDSNRQLQYRISVSELMQFVAGMDAKLRGTGVDQEFLQLAKPQFVPQFEESDSMLTLASERIIYKAKGVEPKLPIASRLYRNFADWAARLNATYPNGPPPFARLDLNASLDEKGLVPQFVERTVLDGKGRQVDVAHTRHLPNWILSQTDRERIVEWETYLTSFRVTDRDEFFGK